MMKGPVVLLTFYSSFLIYSVKLAPQVSLVEIDVVEGDTVDLRCSFDLCINASQVTFTKNGSVHPSTVLSSGLVQLRLVNVTSDQSGPYTCKNPQDPGQCMLLIKTFRVSVFRRPLQPKITRCVVRDWRWAECTWIPSTADQLNHTLMKNAVFVHQSLYVRHLQQSLVWHPVNCTPISNESFCRWSLDGSDFDYFRPSGDEISCARRKQTICFRVEVLNLKLPSFSVSSDSHCINLEDYVLLDDVTNASITPTQRSALLSWRQYRVAPGFTGCIFFKISYRSQWLDNTEWSEIFSNNSEIDMVSLHPYSTYTVRIQAATVGSKIMSTAVDMNFRTKPSAPCKPPTVNENAFYVKWSNKSHRIVYVYWKNISETFRCGDEFGYVVGVTSLDAPPKSYVTNVTSMSVAVSVWESRIDILARNSLGLSTLPERWIRIPRLLHGHDHYKEFIEISGRYENRMFVVEWNLKSNLSEKTEQLEFFWCDRLNDFDHLCLGDLNSLSVPLSEKEITLNFTRCCENYLIGFALDSENNYFYGINWIDCNCGSFHSIEAEESGDYSEERLICLTPREMSAMVVGYIIVVILGTIILIGIVRKCWTDSYKKQIEKVVFPMTPQVKLLEDVDSEYKDRPGVNESNCLLLKVISATPDESGTSKETTLLAIPLENSNSSEVSAEPFCVYVLPKIDDQIPITASDNASIPTTKIYVHYNPLSVTSSNIEVYTSQLEALESGDLQTFYDSDDYIKGNAANERTCANYEDPAEPPARLKYRTESVDSDETDEVATPLLPRSTQQTPRNSVSLNNRTSSDRDDRSVDDENAACRISICTDDSSHSADTDGATLLPKVPRQILSSATESMQDYNCARSFPECPLCTFPGSVDASQVKLTEEDGLDDSCGSNYPSNVLPQLHHRDSLCCDSGYTGGCARNEFFSDEREITSKPAAKLSPIDSRHL